MLGVVTTPGRRTVYSVTLATVKALARYWFLKGFACSGRGAHGESKLRDSKAFAGLLEAEFERAWGDRQREKIPSPDAAVPVAKLGTRR